MKKKCHCYVSKKHVMYEKKRIQKEGKWKKKKKMEKGEKSKSENKTCIVVEQCAISTSSCKWMAKHA